VDAVVEKLQAKWKVKYITEGHKEITVLLINNTLILFNKL
jgi:hypothetical protein